MCAAGSASSTRYCARMRVDASARTEAMIMLDDGGSAVCHMDVVFVSWSRTIELSLAMVVFGRRDQPRLASFLLTTNSSRSALPFPASTAGAGRLRGGEDMFIG